ncbi:MAG: hypothetical protein LBI02_07805 [Opitutaceae bacterium]|jgi:hypothetical protein|nr:hypothetical protein [Opitutaceae bacterium]
MPHPGHVNGEISFDRKSRGKLNAKIAIAEVAAAIVRKRGIVFIGAGSTTLETGEACHAALARPGLKSRRHPGADLRQIATIQSCR